MADIIPIWPEQAQQTRWLRLKISKVPAYGTFEVWAIGVAPCSSHPRRLLMGEVQSLGLARAMALLLKAHLGVTEVNACDLAGRPLSADLSLDSILGPPEGPVAA